FFQAEDGIRGFHVTGVQTCALPISFVGVVSVLPSSAKRQIQTCSSCGCWRFGLPRVPDSRPKSGEIVATPQERAGFNDNRRMARSEERRVGKECRSRCATCREKRDE